MKGHGIIHSWECRIEHSAYILETDVAVRHVLEMIVSVITRDIGGRDLVQFYASMHHHVVVNSSIASSKFVIEKCIRQAATASPRNRANNSGARSRKFRGTGNPPFIVCDARYRMYRICAQIPCIDGNNAWQRYPTLNTRIEISRGAKLLSVDSPRSSFLFDPYFPTGSILSMDIICELILQTCVSVYCDVWA